MHAESVISGGKIKKYYKKIIYLFSEISNTQSLVFFSVGNEEIFIFIICFIMHTFLTEIKAKTLIFTMQIRERELKVTKFTVLISHLTTQSSEKQLATYEAQEKHAQLERQTIK